jgi:hypothetical protein
MPAGGTGRAAALERVVLASIFGLSLAFAGPVFPAEIQDLSLTRHHGRFELLAQAHLDAPVQGIYDVLTDYADDAFARISGIYEESGYAGRDADGTPLVYTFVRGCVLFFCHDMRRVSRLVVRPPNYIRTTALPERSDFKYSVSEWKLEPDGEGADVTYRLVMEPDFFVPPLIGPWVLKKRFREGGLHALERIERLARERAAR